MYEVEVKAMVGNPARNYIGDKSGLWYVGYRDVGSGSVINRNARLSIAKENLLYEEAWQFANELEQKLNPR